MTTVVNCNGMGGLVHESGHYMEGRKILLNSSPNTSVRALVIEPSPQQPNSA